MISRLKTTAKENVIPAVHWGISVPSSVWARRSWVSTPIQTKLRKIRNAEKPSSTAARCIFTSSIALARAEAALPFKLSHLLCVFLELVRTSEEQPPGLRVELVRAPLASCSLAPSTLTGSDEGGAVSEDLSGTVGFHVRSSNSASTRAASSLCAAWMRFSRLAASLPHASLCRCSSCSTPWSIRSSEKAAFPAQSSSTETKAPCWARSEASTCWRCETTSLLICSLCTWSRDSTAALWTLSCSRSNHSNCCVSSVQGVIADWMHGWVPMLIRVSSIARWQPTCTLSRVGACS